MSLSSHTPDPRPRPVRRWSRTLAVGLAAVGLILISAACAAPAPAGPGLAAQVSATVPTLSDAASPTPTATRIPTVVPIPTPAVALTVLPLARPVLVARTLPAGIVPNELGTIPILEVHVIASAKEDEWTITPDHFRNAVKELYDAGYRPISMADLLDRKIDLPAGTSPVLFTFDDSSRGQFRYLVQDGQTVVDPDSAVGILEAFHRSHSDWALKGVFYVLPEAAEPHKLFGQPEYEGQKLRYLVDHGFEIGNHTWWHQRLDTVGDQEVRRQLAYAVRDIKKAVPGYNVRSMALPLGLWPKTRAFAFDGSYDGVSYHNDSVVLVGSTPAPSPFAKEFDPRALPRIQLFGNNLEQWITYLTKHPDERYVSDGDPQTISFPKKLQSGLNASATRNMGVNAG